MFSVFILRIHQPLHDTFLTKNVIRLCFKVMFLLCYKILSNPETTKQKPTKGSSFLCSPHGIFVALTIGIVFTIKE